MPFTLLSALVYAPLLVFTLITLSGSLTLSAISQWGIVVGIGGLLLDLIVTGALVFGVFQHMRGRPAGIGEAIVVGIKRMFPVLLVGLLVGLCVLVGLIALVVPGIIVLCMLYLAVPVAVVERPGIIASLKRSRELTSGYKGTIFGIVFVLGVINNIVSKVLESSFINESTTMSDVKVYLWLVLVVSIIFGTIRAVANAVAYHDLRAEREGVGVEELAKVFE